MRVYQFRHIRAERQCSGVPVRFSACEGVFSCSRRGLSSCRSAARRLLGRHRHGRRAPRSWSRSRAARFRRPRFLAALRRSIPEAGVRWRYRVVLDGFALLVPPASEQRLASLPGVTGVYPSVRYHRTLYRSPFVIGAPQVWGPDLATAGQGIKIGIIDDGIDQTHPFFYPAGYTLPPGFPKGNTAYTTAKVIVARAFPPPGRRTATASCPSTPSSPSTRRTSRGSRPATTAPRRPGRRHRERLGNRSGAPTSATTGC